jgi:radical SAM protein with 4Fe4S-binding SPASM domain
MNDTCSSDLEFFTLLSARASRDRIPLTGSIDLTQRCNLRCVHCYAGPEAGGVAGELSAGEIRGLVDQISEAGCLFLMLTGGDPLARADFVSVYRYIRRSGLFATVFTNGTLITDAVAKVLRDFPPRAVEVSLYGARAETHDAVTRVPGSFVRCLRGMDRLAEAGVPVRLKTVVMSLNRHEIEELARMAEARGLRFRLDAAVFPRFSGDGAPLRYRVSPEEAIASEFAMPDRAEKWQAQIDRSSSIPSHDKLYGCGAGVSSFHIDARGNLQPCLMVRGVRCDLRRSSFRDGWAHICRQMSLKQSPDRFVCNTCDKKAVCDFCPGLFELETGDEATRSEYVCALGQARHARVLADLNGDSD